MAQVLADEEFRDAPTLTSAPLRRGAGEWDWARDLLEEADLARFAQLAEVWRVPHSTKKLGYATHDLVRFFGKFPPPIARHLILGYTKPSEKVVDTMMGSGTTLVEACLLDRRSRGYDPNPVSRLASSVKTRPLEMQDLQTTFARIEKRFNALRSAADFRWEELVPPMVGMAHWFFSEAQQDLVCLRAAIDSESTGARRDFFMLCMVAVVRKASRAGTATGRQFLDKTSVYKPVWPLFEAACDRNMASVSQFATRHEPSIVNWDSREEIGMDDGPADLVICHPPYFNVYNYASILKFELTWLGENLRLSKAREIRDGFKLGKPEKVADYVDDLFEVMKNNVRLCRPGGHIAVMMGDTEIRGSRINTTSLFVKKVEGELPVEIVKLAVRQPKYTEASWATGQRRPKEKLGANMCDFVLVFRRK